MTLIKFRFGVMMAFQKRPRKLIAIKRAYVRRSEWVSELCSCEQLDVSRLKVSPIVIFRREGYQASLTINNLLKSRLVMV